MLIAYLISIATFYLFYLVYAIRVRINKAEITLKKPKEKGFTTIRWIMLSLIPIVNIFFAIIAMYLAILINREKFIETMNGKS